VPECAGCFIKEGCERSTKRREEGTPLVELEKTPPPVEMEETIEPVNPLKHLLQSLEGKYDRADKIGEHAIAHFFSTDGKTIILVTESKATGRLRVKAKDYERIFDPISSIEDAEKILKAVIA